MEFDELKGFLGDRFTTSKAIRIEHSHDESWHVPQNIPVIPFGTGTALEGHTHALKGGITINSSNMNQVIELNNADMDCRVQAGITRKELNNYIKDTGLFFPVDPGADASLGGMCATRASGTNTVRYGTIREQVMGLEVVMPDGKIINTGTRARKSAAGYDLTHLMLGSEGTLGFITEINLKLHGRPEAVSAGVCTFKDLKGAVDTVIESIQIGLPLSRIELLDEVQIKAINQYKKASHEVGPTLFVEIQGTPLGVKEQSEIFKEIANTNNALKFQWSDRSEEIEVLWSARHDAYYAALSLSPGKKAFTTDICVPISKLTDCILETKKDIEKSNIIAPIVGHVGDGNFHLIMLLDPENEKEVSEAKTLNDKLVNRALKMEGTSTGEHGIGIGKKGYLKIEQGLSVEVMSQIKKAIDPKNIMNPGKIFEIN